VSCTFTDPASSCLLTLNVYAGVTMNLNFGSDTKGVPVTQLQAGKNSVYIFFYDGNGKYYYVGGMFNAAP
jgi:hypothetical protein